MLSRRATREFDAIPDCVEFFGQRDALGVRHAGSATGYSECLECEVELIVQRRILRCHPVSLTEDLIPLLAGPHEVG